MLKIAVSGDVILDLYILYGEVALDEYFKTLREEVCTQIQMLKDSGKYQDYCDELYKKLLDKTT